MSFLFLLLGINIFVIHLGTIELTIKANLESQSEVIYPKKIISSFTLRIFS